jgi:hypothetical protein
MNPFILCVHGGAFSTAKEEVEFTTVPNNVHLISLQPRGEGIDGFRINPIYYYCHKYGYLYVDRFVKKLNSMGSRALYAESVYYFENRYRIAINDIDMAIYKTVINVYKDYTSIGYYSKTVPVPTPGELILYRPGDDIINYHLIMRSNEHNESVTNYDDMTNIYDEPVQQDGNDVIINDTNYPIVNLIFKNGLYRIDDREFVYQPEYEELFVSKRYNLKQFFESLPKDKPILLFTLFCKEIMPRSKIQIKPQFKHYTQQKITTSPLFQSRLFERLKERAKPIHQDYERIARDIIPTLLQKNINIESQIGRLRQQEQQRLREMQEQQRLREQQEQRLRKIQEQQRLREIQKVSEQRLREKQIKQQEKRRMKSRKLPKSLIKLKKSIQSRKFKKSIKRSPRYFPYQPPWPLPK